MATQTSFSFEDEDAGEVTITLSRLTIRQGRLQRADMLEKIRIATHTPEDATIGETEWNFWYSFVNAILHSKVSKPVAWWCEADSSAEELLKTYNAFMDSDETLYDLFLENVAKIAEGTTNPKNV